MSNPQRQTVEFDTKIGRLLDNLQKLNEKNLALIRMAPLTPEQASLRAKNLAAIEALMKRIDALGSQPL